MSKTQKNRRISKAVRNGVFGQRGQQPRVGLYARVSTHDQQTLPMQLSAMRDYAKKRKWTVAVEVKDVGSGATTRGRTTNTPSGISNYLLSTLRFRRRERSFDAVRRLEVGDGINSAISASALCGLGVRILLNAENAEIYAEFVVFSNSLFLRKTRGDRHSMPH